MKYPLMPCFWAAKDEDVNQSSKARTTPKKNKVKNTQPTPLGQTAGHLKADSKRLRFRTWLRLKPRRENSTTTKITNTTTQASHACHYSTTQPPDHFASLKLILSNRDTSLDASTPPAYDDQEALPFLCAGLPREDEIRVMQVVDHIMKGVHESLSRRFDLVTLMAIATAVREGCICAAAVVCKVAMEKTVDELNDIINEGCQKTARAVIAATAAAPEKNWIGVASGTAQCIHLAADHHVEYNKKDRAPYAAGVQLTSTVHDVAATIVFRVINGKTVLRDIPLPTRQEFLTGP